LSLRGSPERPGRNGERVLSAIWAGSIAGVLFVDVLPGSLADERIVHCAEVRILLRNSGNAVTITSQPNIKIIIEDLIRKVGTPEQKTIWILGGIVPQ
jgi:hypothetical protein